MNFAMYYIMRQLMLLFIVPQNAKETVEAKNTNAHMDGKFNA